MPHFNQQINSQTDMLRRYIASELSPAETAEAVMPAHTDCSRLLVACRPGDYSASMLAKAVEDCDVQLLMLSVTGMRTDDGRLVVALTVNARSASGVIRSIERYGYEVIHSLSCEMSIEHREAMERVNELIHYLEI
jgi:hypothetical protein